MPRENSTIYDLLISCPGDIVEEIEIIKRVVDDFNRAYGRINNVHIEARHWSTDSYPQSGGKPQELLNSQLVKDCDAAVAVFWTRFGTPTDKYKSGTEEEIEEMLNAGKQVFLYFSDKVIEPSKIDSVQYDSVKALRKKYENSGIYHCYNNCNDFERNFKNHLGLYLLQHITQISNATKPQPSLSIAGFQDGKPSTNVSAIKYPNTIANRTTTIDEKIKKLISEISAINVVLSQNEELELPNDENKSIAKVATYTPITAELSELMNSFKKLGTNTFNPFASLETKATIPDFVRPDIESYFVENNLSCCPGFFDLGNLKQYPSMRMNGFNMYNSISYKGTNDEETKRNKLIDLWLSIEKRKQIINYFYALDKFYIIFSLIFNNGNTFDEDIDVRIFIPKDCMCHINDFPVPEDEIIEYFAREESVKSLFTLGNNIQVEPYSNYPIAPKPYMNIALQTVGKSLKEEISENVAEYKNHLARIFCYNYYDCGKEEAITFNIPYLKQHTYVAFPSFIFLKHLPETIRYEISSKRSPDLITGSIDI